MCDRCVRGKCNLKTMRRTPHSVSLTAEEVYFLFLYIYLHQVYGQHHNTSIYDWLTERLRLLMCVGMLL